MKEVMVIGYDSALFLEGVGNFMFVKRVQGWEIQLDADKRQVVFTR